MQSPRDAVVIRIDHQYPTTVDYADRKVYLAAEDKNDGPLFVGREHPAGRIAKREYCWFVGDRDKWLKLAVRWHLPQGEIKAQLGNEVALYTCSEGAAETAAVTGYLT